MDFFSKHGPFLKILVKMGLLWQFGGKIGPYVKIYCNWALYENFRKIGPFRTISVKMGYFFITMVNTCYFDTIGKNCYIFITYDL